jgi:transcriptional regulator with XRE-family HTH domain
MDRDDLKRWLETHELTRTQLGEILGISRALVSAWTLGTREIPLWLEFAIGEKSIKRTFKKRK